MIQPIVEGYGEVEAVPVLLRRFISESGLWSWEVKRPIRRKRSQLTARSEVEKAVKLALYESDCRAILILFDSDDDCPRQLAPDVESWANGVSRGVPCAVVMAHREYEAWFLASMESLRGKHMVSPDADSHLNPESPRDAKGEVSNRMCAGHTYSETADQAALTQALDMRIVYGRCRSFRKLTDAFGALIRRSGETLTQWPPQSW